MSKHINICVISMLDWLTSCPICALDIYHLIVFLKNYGKRTTESSQLNPVQRKWEHSRVRNRGILSPTFHILNQSALFDQVLLPLYVSRACKKPHAIKLFEREFWVCSRIPPVYKTGTKHRNRCSQSPPQSQVERHLVHTSAGIWKPKQTFKNP